MFHRQHHSSSLRNSRMNKLHHYESSSEPTIPKVALIFYKLKPKYKHMRKASELWCPPRYLLQADSNLHNFGRRPTRIQTLRTQASLAIRINLLSFAMGQDRK